MVSTVSNKDENPTAIGKKPYAVAIWLVAIALSSISSQALSQLQGIQINQQVKQSNLAATNQITVSFTIPTGSNRLLVLNASFSDCRWGGNLAFWLPGDGQSLTRQLRMATPGCLTNSSSANGKAEETWVLLAPTEATDTVAMTLQCYRVLGCSTQPDVHVTVTSLINVDQTNGLQGTTSNGDSRVDPVGPPATPPYTTGTATASSSSTTVTGSGVDWTIDPPPAGAKPSGDENYSFAEWWIKNDSLGVWHRVVSVVSATQLTITPATTAAWSGNYTMMAGPNPISNYASSTGRVFSHGVVVDPGGGSVTLDSALVSSPTDYTWNSTASSNMTSAGGYAPGPEAGYILLKDFTQNRHLWAATILDIWPANATAVTGTSFEAIAQRLGEGVITGNGTTLRWRTGSEVANLGFNLFREDNGVRTQVNPGLIAGSALFVGPRTPLAQGRGYQWTDPNPPTPSTRYWLEALDLSGKKQTFGPVYPSSVRPARNAGEEEDSFDEAVMLSDFALCSEGNATEGRIPGIHADDADLDGSVRPERFTSPVDSNAAPLVTQREIAAGQAAKISVDKEGWYRVALQQLPLGATASASTRYLQLFGDGVEQPVNVVGDSRTGYSVEFYGRPLESEYAKSRVYWLIVGKVPGLRFASQGPTEASLVQPSNFPFTVERKDRVLYFAALTSNGDESNFFGPVVSPTPITQSLTLGKLDTTAGGDWPLRVTLQGVTGAAHSVEVRLNGNLAGYVNFGDQTKGSATLMVPRAWLQEGSNSVVLTAKAGAEDYSLVDSIRITYPHRYELENGVLKFEAAAGTQLELAGAAKGVPRILDITDLGAITELRVAAAPGVARAVVPGAAGQRTLLAFSTNLLAPLSVKANTPSSWSADKTKSDLTIVTNSAFASAAAALKNRRQAEGLLVKVVDVEDLYDEYSYGAKNPASIRSFLAGNAPRYVALMGDSTFDPRNYLGFGDFDFIPSKSIPTEYFKTASDDWFVDFNATGIPQIPIGRFAVRSASEATTAVNKVIAADQARLSGASWLTKVLHVADQDDPLMAPYSFEGEVSGLSAVVPSNYNKSQILVGQTGVPAARASILSAFNEGALLYTFMGHGSQDRWSKSNVLDLSSAAGLNGSSRVPVLLALDCLNGLFIDVYGESLAERLQRQAGGPAAVWASTGFTSPYGQVDMAKAFYQQIFRRTSVRLGDAARAAKLTVTDPDVRKTWTLFGDPSMIVR